MNQSGAEPVDLDKCVVTDVRPTGRLPAGADVGVVCEEEGEHAEVIHRHQGHPTGIMGASGAHPTRIETKDR